MTNLLNLISLWTLPVIIITILTCALVRKIQIYEVFTDGAKDGFKVSISIIPYLVALIVAISMFRASGALEWLSGLLKFLPVPADILPIMFTRSLSGSATLGLFAELAAKHGANAFITKMAAIMVGSSETTFYVLAVYFGSIGIKKFRYAILTGIIADITGIVLAILAAHLFFLPNIG